MKRRLARLALAAGTVALLGLLLVAASAARPQGAPFYVIPSSAIPSTTECQGLAYCYGVRGPWVIVPAHGEATFLFGCPERSKAAGAFLLGGTDSLASSDHVHVWFDSPLGTPIGMQTPKGSTTGLLFHAVTDNGKPGSFQPVLGCIDLIQASKYSTVASTLPTAPPAGVRAVAAPGYTATLVVLEPGWDRPVSVACPQNESLVGNWGAAAFGTEGPPILDRANPVKMTITDRGNTVHALVRTASWIPYLIRIQIGAMCEQ